MKCGLSLCGGGAFSVSSSLCLQPHRQAPSSYAITRGGWLHSINANVQQATDVTDGAIGRGALS
jgi:hypothetical protein